MIRRGFTLIELLVFVAIFSISIIGFITVFITVTRVQSRQSSSDEVLTQGQFLIQQIQYYIQTANLVAMTQDVASSSLLLTEQSPSISPTTISLATGTVYLQQGSGGALQQLTTNKVTVTNLLFTRHFNLSTSSSPFGSDSVSYSFTMTGNASNSTQIYSQTFQSSAAVLIPVPKIALVQQVKSEQNVPSFASMSSTFVMTNSTGSLLLVVIANATTTSVVNASDTIGNVWTRVASTSYPALNTELNIFAAVNAKNGTNTVTASFTPTAGYGSMFIYEYRGAATSSSFDASSTFITANSATPSSSSTNPTSSVELLFGALYSSPFTQTPSAAAGFTIETSSTVSQTVIEDENMYITGPVAATWTYASITPSSSAVIVTFK